MATDERSYVLRSCDGTLDVDADRLLVQGAPHANGRPRNPVLTERDAIATLRLTCGLFGATLHRVLPAGYRSLVIRVRDVTPLLDDLRANGWPVELRGWRRPKG